MFEVIRPGLETSVQDLPGRIGYWEQGFPPSGPVTHGFSLTNGVARRCPRLSKKMGILPADEKSSAQAGLQRGDPSGFLKSPKGSAGLSFHSTVAYQAAAPTDATSGRIEEMALYCGLSCSTTSAEMSAADVVAEFARVLPGVEVVNNKKGTEVNVSR